MENVEKSLCDAVKLAKKNIDSNLKVEAYDKALVELAKLREPIDKFFDGVMIMDKDKKLQDNRLKILNAFTDVFSNIADFSKMAKTK